MSDSLPTGFLESPTVTSGSPLQINFPLSYLENHSLVYSNPHFSNRTNWKYISVAFKTAGSIRKSVGHRAKSGEDFLRTFKVTATPGSAFSLYKIVIKGTNGSILTIKRAAIPGAETGDIAII